MAAGAAVAPETPKAQTGSAGTGGRKSWAAPAVFLGFQEADVAGSSSGAEAATPADAAPGGGLVHVVRV